MTLFAIIIYAGFTYRLLKTNEAANRISLESLVSVQRAFLFHRDPVMPIVEGGRTLINTYFDNSGTTPARNVHVNESIKFYEQATVANTFFDEAPALPGMMTIPPRTSFQTSPAGDITFDELLQAKQLRGHVYLWGWIRYRDVFPQDDSHLTEFCAELVELDRATPKGDDLRVAYSTQWTPCADDKHNCSDEDCPDYKTRMVGY